MRVFTYFAGGIIEADPLPQVEANQSTLTIILSIGFGVIGALAVLMIVVSGLRYITAGGDSAKTSSARSQLIYALIGLVIAGMAEVIVNFVLNL